MSPIYECSFHSGSVKHFFLYCSRYAAQRNVHLASAAKILGETWSSSSAARKLNVLLYVVGSVNYDVNRVFFTKYKAL